jgi:four helix bundle protein
MNTGTHVEVEDTRGYRKIIAWQRADDLVHAVYEATADFPKSELFGLTSQLRRAALSVPTNIVEGCGRQNRGELKQFVNIALGSLAEVEYLLSFAARRGYLVGKSAESVEAIRTETGRLLWRFFRSL